MHARYLLSSLDIYLRRVSLLWRYILLATTGAISLADKLFIFRVSGKSCARAAVFRRDIYIYKASSVCRRPYACGSWISCQQANEDEVRMRGGVCVFAIERWIERLWVFKTWYAVTERWIKFSCCFGLNLNTCYWKLLLKNILTNNFKRFFIDLSRLIYLIMGIILKQTFKKHKNPENFRICKYTGRKTQLRRRHRLNRSRKFMPECIQTIFVLTMPPSLYLPTPPPPRSLESSPFSRDGR